MGDNIERIVDILEKWGIRRKSLSAWVLVILLVSLLPSVFNQLTNIFPRPVSWGIVIWLLGFLAWLVFRDKFFRKLRRANRLVEVASLVLVTVVVGYGVFFFHVQGGPLPSPTPANKIGIWVAQFPGDTERAQVRLRRQIEDVVAQDPDLYNKTEVRDLARVVSGETTDEQFAKAAELGEKVNATFVLFGEVNQGFLQLRMRVVGHAQLFVEPTARFPDQPIDLENIDLPPVDVQATVVLARIVIGFDYYERGYHDKALTVLESVAEELGGATKEGVEGLGFVIANSNLLLAQQFPNPRPHLNAAITLYQSLLTSSKVQQDTRFRPAVLNDLGHAHTELSAFEDSVPNLTKAIGYFQESLSYYSKLDSPLLYARVMSNLGRAYALLSNYDEPAANVDKAIRSLEEARDCITPDMDTVSYATILNNLGSAYAIGFRSGGQVEILEQAIGTFVEGLELLGRKPKEAPLLHATMQNNLGLAYIELAYVEHPLENLARAVELFNGALEYRKLEVVPLQYAATEYNLGNGYFALALKGQPEQIASNLNLAISAYGEALRFFPPETSPVDYQKALRNLVACYGALAIQEQPVRNLELAIQVALEGLREVQLVGDIYASIENNLGWVYEALSRYREREANLREAIPHYSVALVIWSRAATELAQQPAEALTRIRHLLGPETFLNVLEQEITQLNRIVDGVDVEDIVLLIEQYAK